MKKTIKKKTILKKVVKKKAVKKKVNISKKNIIKKVSNFEKPYKSPNRTNLTYLIKKTGVYIIKENNIIVYIGRSGVNLYKTMYRHFEHWEHKTQQVITYKHKLNKNKYSVKYILCSPSEAIKLEKALILKHKPRDNEQKYEAYKTDKKIIKSYNNFIVKEKKDKTTKLSLYDKKRKYSETTESWLNPFLSDEVPY